MRVMTRTFVQTMSKQLCRLVCVLFSSCHFFSIGISQSIDTLNLTKTRRADTIKVDQLNAMSKQYWKKNLDSAIYFAQKALHLSQALNYKMGIAESYRNMGVTNAVIGDKNVSKKYLLSALALFSELPDRKGMAATYNNLGVLYSSKSEFSISLKYYDSALVLFRKIANKEGEGSVLNYIGINYQNEGNYQKAIDYCLQAFEIRKEINDHQGVVYSLINVGNMYLDVGQPQTALNFYNQSVSYAKDHNMDPFDYSLNQIGKTYLKLKQYDKAEAYLVRKINGEGARVSDHLAIGELYSLTGRPDSAIKHYNISFTEAEEGNNNTKALSLIGLSKVYLKKGEYKLAMSYAKQAYNVAASLQNKLILADVANVLAVLHKKNGDFKKAIQYFELAHSVTDSVTSENYQRKLAFNETKNEIENERAQVKLLSVEQALQDQKLKGEQLLKKFILIVFAVVVFLSFTIIKNINRKRKKIQSQKDQIEMERARVETAYEELKSTQAQLIQSEKMASLGELTAGIAHEIQNPLNFVNNFSEVNKELIDEMQQELITGNNEGAISISKDIKDNEQKINEHGRRADTIVKSMLQHSRVSSGQKELTDINALAGEYLRLSFHGMRAKEKSFNATIQTDFDPSIEKTRIIPPEIGRVLLNLFNNAFYAVADRDRHSFSEGEGVAGYQPTVSVSTKKINNKIEITIADNGNGVPKKSLNKIFQPFFTTKPAGQGTGLGLSLSYDIIKAHGGEIKVASKEGEGATFVIQLPINHDLED